MYVIYSILYTYSIDQCIRRHQCDHDDDEGENDEN